MSTEAAASRQDCADILFSREPPASALPAQPGGSRLNGAGWGKEMTPGGSTAHRGRSAYRTPNRLRMSRSSCCKSLPSNRPS